jgi:hypothetical protein
MIMEYIYFMGCVAAVGAIVLLFWHFRDLGRSWLFGTHGASEGSGQAVPPFKKTISGLSEKELERINFQDRLEAWQKAHEARYNHFHSSNDALKGKKYVYEPTGRKSERSTAQSSYV